MRFMITLQTDNGYLVVLISYVPSVMWTSLLCYNRSTLEDNMI